MRRVWPQGFEELFVQLPVSGQRMQMPAADGIPGLKPGTLEVPGLAILEHSQIPTSRDTGRFNPESVEP